MRINKNGIIDNESKLRYLINNFTETKTTTDWSFGSSALNSSGTAVFTGANPGFSSTYFTVNPTDIVVVEFSLSLPVPSTTTSGPGLYLGTKYGQKMRDYVYNFNTNAYTNSSITTNPYFIYSYNSTNQINVKTYILGSNVDIRRVPPTKSHVLQLVDDTSTYLRSGYNSNTSMTIHLSNVKIYKLDEVNFSEHYSDPISSVYDNTIYTEPDGSKWIRIFHHNNPASSGLFASDMPFTDSVYVDSNRWFNVSVCNRFVKNNTWELMVKQKTTSDASETKYRWTQKTNPMAGTWNDVQPSSSNIVRNTSSGYITNGGGIYCMNSSSYLNIANVTSSNWYGAIGSWTVYQGGIPGYPNTVITTGYMDLYLRIDIDNKVNMNKSGILTNQIYEV